MLALGTFSLLSLAWCTLAPQWALTDRECHLQSLNILPATSAPPPPLCLFHCPPLVAALLLSLIRTRLSRDVGTLSTLLPTPKSCQPQWPLGASSLPGKQGTHVCDSFYSLFFFLEWGFSNYPPVYANTEEALGAIKWDSAFIRNLFYFPNRICQTYSFLFR